MIEVNDLPVAPAVTSGKWIQVCEIERGTFAEAKRASAGPRFAIAKVKRERARRRIQ